MRKVVDITEKLDFNENPVIAIKGQELEVNADAATVLKIMGFFGEEAGPKQIVEMCDLIFTDESKEKLDALKLSYKDYEKTVMAAIELITGTDPDETPGEAPTHTTT